MHEKEIGNENVFDFSLGNPSIPAPEKVNKTIVEILKKRDEDRLEQYFAEGFIYYDNNNNVEYKYLDNFWIDLTTYISSYEIEKKDDANEENLEAYEVYWNIVEANKNIGIDKTDKNYCLQRIRIILKKVVMKDFITYKLNRIVLTNK